MKRKEKGTVVEAFLVFATFFVSFTAIMILMLAAFSNINNKWQQRQVARQYLLLCETQGYLTPSDLTSMTKELEGFGLTNIKTDGTTVTEAPYGSEIRVCISGTYNQNILRIAGSGNNAQIQGLGTTSVPITINRTSTAKQQD